MENEENITKLGSLMSRNSTGSNGKNKNSKKRNTVFGFGPCHGEKIEKISTFTCMWFLQESKKSINFYTKCGM